MNGRLKIFTAPDTEPVTLDEALTQCHADAGIEDAWFTATIRAAREAAETFQRRAYITQVWDLSFDGKPDLPIYIPRSPIISVDSIDVYDDENVKTECDLSDFFIDLDTDPARITLNRGGSWPAVQMREMSAVKIRFTAGYGAAASTVPASVKDAILLYVTHNCNNRAGEVEFPKQFFDLLRPNRLYT